MGAMETADVQHLAALARIALTDTEAAALAREFDAILGYVAQVRDISGDVATAPEAGPVVNVFREDVETNKPEEYLEALLAAVPEREGRYVAVKKVLAGAP